MFNFGGLFDLPRKEEELALLENSASQPDFWADSRKAKEAQKQIKILHWWIDTLKSLETRADDCESLEMLAETFSDEQVMNEVVESIDKLEIDVNSFEQKKMLSGEDDVRPVIFSIHAGAGGTEACDWVRILLEMYLSWFRKKNIEFEIIDDQPGDVAGFKSVSIEVKSEFAYGYLKSENGVHRLVRVSPFDADKRRHTSFAAVNVYPIADEVDFSIVEKDVEISTFKASGKGGQYTNKTDSAVRAVHKPTGIVVACQSERSQHSNRMSAMKLLDAKVVQHLKEMNEAKQKSKEMPKQKIEWSSQIRSYVVQPQQSVKDNRSGFETTDIDKIFGGDLDGMIHAYLLLINRSA